jgi:phosphoserine phosphatase
VLDYFFPQYEKLFSHVMINRLIFDGNGKVTGVEPTEFGADRYKIEGLRSIARKENISTEECVFIGDSDNDVEIAMGAGLGIGFMPHEKLASVCDVVIRKKDLREILKHIE